MSDVPRVLVVDDDPVARAAISGLLRRRYEVVTAATADEALTAFKEQRFDVALVDVMLPDRDGCALTEQVRALPRGAKVPILIISGRRSFATRKK